MAAADGTRLHEYAAMAIRLGIRQSRIKSTLNMYINDSIGFRLTPEQPLYYSENCFGHADACGFSKDTLRIFDYKSGTNPTSYRQLETYAALFCLEYMFNPFQITIILRIYQNNEFREVIADPDSITKIMETIKRRDRRIEELREEALS